MIRKKPVTTRLLGWRLALSIAVAMSITPAATPAQADFINFLSYVNSGYGLFDKFILNHDPSDLQQMKGLINQAKTQILAELDGLAAAWNSSCAANALDTFQNIDQLTPDNLQAFAISSDKCVTDAQALIGAASDKGAIDKIGFALNTVGPIALLVNAHAGFPTDDLKLRIMSANQQLRRRLTPICDVSIDNPGSLPRFSGPITGYGACYNYTVPTPPRLAVGEYFGGVFYLSDGPGRAFLSWPLVGYAHPDDVIAWWRGHGARWPAPQDFSIAIRQVMQGTSWQIAGAVLDLMEPAAWPFGSPVALTVSTDTQYSLMGVFRTNGDGSIFRGAMFPYPDGSNLYFSGWGQMDGALRSVAAAANADGRVEMFGISRIGGIFHRWQQFPGDDSSWSPWAQMDGQLNTITAARNQDGTLQVIGTNPKGDIFTRRQILGGDHLVGKCSVQSHFCDEVLPDNPVPAIDAWTDWTHMDGVLSQVAAVTDTDGLIHLFGIDRAGTLFHRRQAAPNASNPSVSVAWTDWDQVDIPGPLSSIAVAIDLRGQVNIFGISSSCTISLGSDDPARCFSHGHRNVQLFQRVKLGGENNYSAWSQIPGSMYSVTATKEGGIEGRLVLIGSNADGNVYRNLSEGPVGLSPGTWKGWEPLTVNLLTVPNVIGRNAAQATDVLRSSGLGNPSKHQAIDPDCSHAVGTVTEEDPPAGAQVSPGFIVQLGIVQQGVCNN